MHWVNESKTESFKKVKRKKLLTFGHFCNEVVEKLELPNFPLWNNLAVNIEIVPCIVWTKHWILRERTFVYRLIALILEHHLFRSNHMLFNKISWCFEICRGHTIVRAVERLRRAQLLNSCKNESLYKVTGSLFNIPFYNRYFNATLSWYEKIYWLFTDQ